MDFLDLMKIFNGNEFLIKSSKLKTKEIIFAVNDG